MRWNRIRSLDCTRDYILSFITIRIALPGESKEEDLDKKATTTQPLSSLIKKHDIVQKWCLKASTLLHFALRFYASFSIFLDIRTFTRVLKYLVWVFHMHKTKTCTQHILSDSPVARGPPCLHAKWQEANFAASPTQGVHPMLRGRRPCQQERVANRHNLCLQKQKWWKAEDQLFCWIKK